MATSLLSHKNTHLSIKLLETPNPHVSGNKYYKLKNAIKAAKAQNLTTLVTFGGAFSNHIAATAAAGHFNGLATVGYIRGEELGKDLKQTLSQNPTLKFASDMGMTLHFISREAYRHKDSEIFKRKLKNQFSKSLIIPEGGTTALAVKGCETILEDADEQFDHICCPVGTGGTISGIINASKPHQMVLGFPALKGDFLSEEIKKYTSKTNWELISDYHFGGYAKLNLVLVEFINEFRKDYNIQLDPIYTGKMLFGLTELLKAGHFPENSRILAVHTGGLQGIAGMNLKLKKKGLPLIEL